MSYYVLKHSAKGTTWGEHKYIRKEGNRYIYPEDVKKSSNDNTSDNSNIDEYLKSLPESSFKTNYEKGISMDQISKNDFDALYKNDPEFKKLAYEYYNKNEKEINSNLEKQDKNSVKVETKTASDNIEKQKELNEAKRLADLHRIEEYNKKDAEEAEKRYNALQEKNRQSILYEAKLAADYHRKDPDVLRQNKITAYANSLKNVSDEELNNRLKRLDDLKRNKQTYTRYNIELLQGAINRELSIRQELKDKKAKEAKEEHDSRAAQAVAEKEKYLKRAENKKKVENKRDRLEYIRNARKTRNRDKKYVVDTEDGGAFVTRNREKAVQVRNEVKQNKLKREDPIKYYLQRRKSKRK